VTRITRSTMLLCALCALCAGSVIGPSIASAKSSHKVTMKVTKACKQVGSKICATYGGSPFGTCKMTGTLVIPKTIQTWKCKGGTFRVTANGTTGAANDAKGTWKLSKGTGKYKGISGKGTFAGQLSTGLFTYKGTAKY
jgi:hypothetical protein